MGAEDANRCFRALNWHRVGADLFCRESGQQGRQESLVRWSSVFLRCAEVGRRWRTNERARHVGRSWRQRVKEPPRAPSCISSNNTSFKITRCRVPKTPIVVQRAFSRPRCLALTRIAGCENHTLTHAKMTKVTTLPYPTLPRLEPEGKVHSTHSINLLSADGV